MRLPTKEEIIKILNITEYEYDEVMQINNPVSLDKVVGEDLALYEVIGDREKDIALLVALKQELQNLNKEEKELINSRYVYGETQREVADLLNKKQVDVSRKEKKILLKLKTRLKS